MFCLGPNPDQLTIFMAHSFHWLLPRGAIVGFLAFLMALRFPTMKRSNLILVNGSFLLLAEPTAYLTSLWITPVLIYRRFDEGVFGVIMYTVLLWVFPFAARW